MKELQGSYGNDGVITAGNLSRDGKYLQYMGKRVLRVFSWKVAKYTKNIGLTACTTSIK